MHRPRVPTAADDCEGGAAVTLYAFDDIDDAIDATRAFLWPFDLGRWAKLALVLFFLGGTGGSFNPFGYNFGGTGGGPQPPGEPGGPGVPPDVLPEIGGPELAVILAIAAAIVLGALPGGGARGFVVAVSGVNTSNAVFALFALVALGSPRTGVLVALNEAAVPLNLPLLLGAVALASAVGVLLVPVVGDRYLAVAGRVDYPTLSVALLFGLAGLAYLFAGVTGVGAFAIASVVGMIPPKFGARRVHLMGVLMGPLIVG